MSELRGCDDDEVEVRPDERPFEDAPPEVVRALGGMVPTVQQWQAISHPLEPYSIVAGAGSGKTAVMAARVVYLALVELGRIDVDHRGVPPSRVLCLTFTNKAAEALARRVLDAVAGLGLPEGEEPTVLTYHAFASSLMDEYGLRLELDPKPHLLSDAKKWQLASSLLEDVEFVHNEIRSIGSIVDQMLELADQCQNHLVDPAVVAERSREMASSIVPRGRDDRDIVTAARKRAELAEMAGLYRERKRERGLIDYGDQISLAARLVDEHPEVAVDFRERFEAVLLDEFQDTNVAQAKLLRGLLEPGFPVTAVGDPDQNIYAWRGASLHNILRFPEEFPGVAGPAPRKPLFVNFRSGSRILAVADEVIQPVPEERRPPDKELRPHPARGRGRVLAFVAADERAEGRRIAALIHERLADRPPADDGQPPWRDVAVLCRKRRLFAPIAEVLREEGIPVEIVDLGGLLKMPEIVDLVAWLRVIDDPSRNVALARVLQGPGWRIGHRDLAALARWSAVHNQRLGKALSEAAGQEIDRPGDVAFALAESLDHLDDTEMTDLSEEARERLSEFRTLLATLRAAARGPLGDLVALVAEESGLLREVEAARSPAAAATRANVLNLVDHVAAFSPVEGEASLATLIEYLDVAEEREDELEPAQPSEANTVKLLTIHKAKGLEWPIVFVPGMAEHDRSGSSIFPDTSRQPNPLTQPRTLPFELRGDRDSLPSYGGKLDAFKAELSARAEEEERRLCYVALTRARDVLVVSSAHWYSGPAEAHHPGRFYREVAAHPCCEGIGDEEPPQDNPILAARRARVGAWPPPARADDADGLFPEGWHRAAEVAVAEAGAVRSRAEALGPERLKAFDRALAEDAERAALIQSRTTVPASPPVPSTLSVSSLIDYLRCPKLFFWSQVRPLPRRPSPAARLGSEVHRWIELQSRGQATLIDVEDLPDLSTEERLGEAPDDASLKDRFRESRFAEEVPFATERPFLLYLDGMVVGGRIDAIFGRPEGPWEVVDYKTGRVPPEDDPLLGLQLDVYALACTEVWGKRPEDIRLTYFYLATGEERTRGAGDPAATRARVAEALAGVAAGRFEATPGRQCGWCDFLAFCEPGRAFLEANPPPD